MKKLLLLIIYNVLLIALCAAQNPLVKQWDKRFGGTWDDELLSFEQTKDGGYILGGRSASSVNGDKTQPLWGGAGYDYWIIKIDSLGNKQWDKDFGGTNNDFPTSIKQTIDGGYIIGGYSNSPISGDKTQDNWGGFNFYDYWILKTDSLGNKQWDKDFGGVNDDYLLSLHQTSDGGYILGGYSESGISGDKTQNTWGGFDYWILKTDSLGNKQWDKDLGGTANDEFSSLQLTSDGGYILGGASFSGISGDKTQANWDTINPSTPDYWIIKMDSSGTKQWDKTFGGSSGEYLFSLSQTIDQGYIFAGYSASGISGDKTQPTWGGSDYWIVKTDSLGNKQWDKDFGGADNEGTGGSWAFGSITQTNDKGYLIGGSSLSNISGDKTENNLGPKQTWIIKTDSLGLKQWDKTLFTNSVENDEKGRAIQTSDGCYLMVNCTNAEIGGYKTQPNWDTICTPWCTIDYWIIKFCDTTSTTSIKQIANYPNTFSISPNPARESVVISSEYGEKNKTTLILFDVFGNEQYRDMLRTPNYRLPVSSLSPGIYFLKAGNEVRKFVKE